jgi:hypothetical protein
LQQFLLALLLQLLLFSLFKAALFPAHLEGILTDNNVEVNVSGTFNGRSVKQEPACEAFV